MKTTCDYGALPGLARVLELGNDAESVEFFVFWETAQIDQSRVNVEKAHRFGALCSGLETRSRDNKWNPGGFFPQGSFRPLVFFSEVETMIAPENDDGVVAVWSTFKAVKNGPDTMIGEANGGEIGMDHATPALVFQDFIVSRFDVDLSPKIWREIIEVRPGGSWHGDGFPVVNIKPLLGNQKRNVGTEDTCRNEEGSLVLFL